MTRIAAYLGPLAPVATVVEQGTFSLAAQAADHADGFGIAWYPDDEQPDALRLAAREPIWTSNHLLEIPRRLRSRCVLAGLRRCSDGLAPELSGTQPFQRGPYLFIHDGELTNFREIFARPLLDGLSEPARQSLTGLTAPELLFTSWLDAIGERTGPDALADALEAVVAKVRAIAHETGAPATFSMVVSDGTALVVLRSATHGIPPPLHTIVAGDDTPFPPTSRVIASEFLFPGAWTTLDVHSLTIFTAES